MKRSSSRDSRTCPRCRYRGPDFVYVPHLSTADGKFTLQDFWKCPSCGAQSTGLDKRRTRVR